MILEGTQPATSPREVADRAGLVFAGLPSPDALREVVLGRDGLLRGRAITTRVDLSTVGSTTAEAVATGMRKAGVAYVGGAGRWVFAIFLGFGVLAVAFVLRFAPETLGTPARGHPKILGARRAVAGAKRHRGDTPAGNVRTTGLPSRK